MILERLQGSRFSRVLPLWQGKTVVLIGGGSSLTVYQVEHVRNSKARCIAVNAAYLIAPWADVCYFADSQFWKWHDQGVECAGLEPEEVREKFRGFAGQKCSIQNSGANVTDEAVHILRNKTFPQHGKGLSTDPEALMTGRNSGFQALNMATLAGARRVLLLGFDGSPIQGKTHWHGAHPRPTPIDAYPHYRQALSAAESELKKLGVEVLNCSPGSMIDTFPKVSIERAL